MADPPAATLSVIAFMMNDCLEPSRALMAAYRAESHGLLMKNYAGTAMRHEQSVASIFQNR